MVAPALIAAGITAGGSILGGLLGKKEKEPEPTKWTQTATTKQKEAYKAALAASEANRELGVGVRDDLMGNPQEWAALSPQEQEALAMRGGALDSYNSAVSGANALYGPGTFAGDMMTNPNGTMADLYAQYENPYEDDVVNTTLANMDRDQLRKLAELSASTSSAGGTTNTRGAVQSAISNNLHGMNRAEMEAKMRAAGFDTSREFGNNQADRLLDLTGDRYDQQYMAAGDAFDNVNTYADDVGAFGAENRRIGDLNAEAARTAERDAVAWYDSLYNTDPMAGVGTGGAYAPAQPKSNGWLDGAGIGAGLASAYLKNAAPPSSAGG